MLDNRLTTILDEQPYPLIFSTVSGAHLYGFPSPDSDYDVRGVHILPVAEVVSLGPFQETIQTTKFVDKLEIDLVTHDIKKYFEMLLKKNGYVLEQLYSPLVLHTTPEHDELKFIAQGCITREHNHHYVGFSENQWKLFNKEWPPRVKPLLYVYRVLLTGIHLMNTGEIEANLLRLNEVFRLPYIPELVERKLAGAEKSTLDDADLAFHSAEYQRLRTELDHAYEASALPTFSSARDALNELLLRIRLKHLA